MLHQQVGRKLQSGGSMQNFETALVTGGSHGLGRALAEALAQRGVRVIIAARELEALEFHASALRQRGLTVHAVQADLADKTAIHPLAAQAAALVGPIDVLINNASTLGPNPLAALADTECEDFEQALAVNLVGPFRLTKSVLGSMLVRQRGLIVNISSDAAVQAYPSWGAYGASKAALDHLTRTWANELPETSGVRMISVDPGEMDTRMHRAALPDVDPAELAAPREVAEHILNMIATPSRAPHGARLEVSTWRTQHASAA
jgi:NAD(P)-dependent dehydrogenase (short-subunit alcohol dehydrogenase family)